MTEKRAVMRNITKEEYLKEMEKRLKRLPPEERQNAMEYFREYLDEVSAEDGAQAGDATGVQKAIQELGTPKEAAAEVMERLLDEQLTEGGQKTGLSSVRKNISLAVLAICAAPIGLPLLAATLALALAGVLVALSIVICGFAGSLALICMAGKLLIRGVLAMAVSFSGGLMLAGIAVVGAGCSLLLFVLTVFCCKWIGRGITVLAKRMVERGNRK